MKRGGERLTLTDGDDLTRAWLGSQNLDLRADPLNPGRPDEDRMKWRSWHSRQLDVALEGVDLPSERVAPYGHVDAAQRLLGAGPVHQVRSQQDHARARAEDRHFSLD